MAHVSVWLGTGSCACLQHCGHRRQILNSRHWGGDRARCWMHVIACPVLHVRECSTGCESSSFRFFFFPSSTKKVVTLVTHRCLTARRRPGFLSTQAPFEDIEFHQWGRPVGWVALRRSSGQRLDSLQAARGGCLKSVSQGTTGRPTSQSCALAPLSRQRRPRLVERSPDVTCRSPEEQLLLPRNGVLGTPRTPFARKEPMCLAPKATPEAEACDLCGASLLPLVGVKRGSL